MNSLLLLLAAVSCTLTVTPKPGESHTTKSNSGLIRRTTTTTPTTGSKTMTRNMKWTAEVRIRENRPEKLEIESIYIGQEASGNIIQLGKTEKKPLELDKNGRASTELTSPTVRLTKSRTTSSGSHSRGFRSTHTTTHGERVTGCVVRVYADGELVKSWSSDSRWASEANKPTFSISELNKKKSTIGLR